MRLLLDTHALIWWMAGSSRLSGAARKAIAETQEVLVSAASAWEVTTKFRLGKLPSAERLVRNFAAEVAQESFQGLAVTLDHASFAGSLDTAHKDPFDRLLIAQARIERMPIVSNEKLFDDFGVERLW